MGSFFSNIHVLAADPQSVSLIRERLRDAILAGPYQEHDDMTPADRNVIIANTSNPRWVAVYDEDADAPDIPELERLAAAVSQAGYALAASVSDSDVLYLSLFANGQRLERITFNPLNRRHRRPKHPEWRRLLSADQLHSFRESFRSNVAFAEYPLERLAESLGFDPDFALLGYRYRDDLPDGPREHLRFLLRPEARFYERIEGPPELSSGSRRTWKLSAGETASVRVPFVNLGGEGRGLTVAVPWSTAQEQILRIEKFHINCADAGQEFELLPERVDVEGDRFLRGPFPDLHLEPYIKWPENLSFAQLRKITEIINRHTLHLEVTVTGLATGKTELLLFLMPKDNPREGRSVAPCNIEVSRR